MIKRHIAVLAAGGALALAGCGADAATSTTGANGTAQQTQGGRPPGGGMDFTALANELGVSTAKLQAAMQKNRPAQGQAPGSGGAGDMAANLAKELGLTAKVQAALKKLMPQGGPPNGTPPQGGNSQAPPSGTPAAGTTS